MELARHVDARVQAVADDLATVHMHVPHVGHACREQHGLERVLGLPAGKPHPVECEPSLPGDIYLSAQLPKDAQAVAINHK